MSPNQPLYVLESVIDDDPPPGTIALRLQNWNDWWEFRTAFSARYIDTDGTSHRLGEVKIADVRHTYEDERGKETPLPKSFDQLDPAFFASVGQSEKYYERIRTLLGPEDSRLALRALGDLAEEPSRLEDFRNYRVVSKSLMREVAAATIKNKLHRIVVFGGGNAGYHFRYFKPTETELPIPPSIFEFEVRPNSYPPTNVHALIGRNGSGKTTLLRSMAKAMLGSPIATKSDGYFESESGEELDIANLVYVSFSAFDVMPLPVLDKQVQWAVPYSYVGLQYPVEHPQDQRGMEQPEDLSRPRGTQPAEALEDSFAESAMRVVKKGAKKSWEFALATLESDPNFHEAEVSRLAGPRIDAETIEDEARRVWRTLSTGHKIVLLTITRLVETVIERTLVLIDEPEGHLHPPLLSALIRAISDLLKERNGVALVATHSPVVLQEIPRSCATKVRRSGIAQIVERPNIETFGESVGVLTSEVFSLEVTDAGFHKLVTNVALEVNDFDKVVETFGDQLGYEARAVLASWFAARKR